MANPAETHELLRKVARHGAVMEAFVNGKPVQIKTLCSDKWEDCLAPSWNNNREYRIKPEPRKVFVRLYDDGSANAYTQNGLDKYLHAADPTRKEYVEFVEVIK